MKMDNDPFISFCLAISDINASKTPMIVSFSFHNLHHQTPAEWLTILEEIDCYSLKRFAEFILVLSVDFLRYLDQHLFAICCANLQVSYTFWHANLIIQIFREVLLKKFGFMVNQLEGDNAKRLVRSTQELLLKV